MPLTRVKIADALDHAEGWVAQMNVDSVTATVQETLEKESFKRGSHHSAFAVL